MRYNFYISPTEYETAKQNGISQRLLTDRIRVLGWNIKKAMTIPPKKQSNRKEWIDIAMKNNIPPSVFYERVSKGTSPEQASTMPVMDKRTLIDNIAISKRKYPKEYEDMATANGIGKKTFVSRMFRKWNPLEAATTPVKR